MRNLPNFSVRESDINSRIFVLFRNIFVVFLGEQRIESAASDGRRSADERRPAEREWQTDGRDKSVAGVVLFSFLALFRVWKFQRFGIFVTIFEFFEIFCEMKGF